MPYIRRWRRCAFIPISLFSWRNLSRHVGAQELDDPNEMTVLGAFQGMFLPAAAVQADPIDMRGYAPLDF